MDGERFDTLIQSLGDRATRRGVLGVLAGAAGLGLSEAAAKGRRGGRTRGQAAKAGKVDICHHDQETDTYHHINISKNAVQKHIDNHGDFFPAADNGCCSQAECGENETCVFSSDNVGSCAPTSDVCPVGSDACSTATAAACAEGCSCATTVEGLTACRETVSDCSNPIPCNSSAECEGGLCVIVTNCCAPDNDFAGICSTQCAGRA
jgi:hypothetical protein